MLSVKIYRLEFGLQQYAHTYTHTQVRKLRKKFKRKQVKSKCKLKVLMKKLIQTGNKCNCNDKILIKADKFLRGGNMVIKY